MCRLMALTFTNPRLLRVKADILDRMLLMSQTDDNQNDGFGVTDGHKLVKNNNMYSVCVPSWKPELDPAEAWLAHIRKASTTTGRTVNESHPYEFVLENGESLFAAHNGFIHGTNWNIDRKAEVKGAPNTDSWRAFCQLWLDLLEMEKVDGGADLLPQVFENWTPNFEENSQFAMLFHWRGNIIALRHDRPLHCMRVGNGHIVHTSLEFLKVLRENLKWQYHLECEDPKYIDKDNMVIFRPGVSDIEVHKLNLAFKPKYVQSNYTQNTWQGHGGSHAGNAATVVNQSPKSSANESVTNNDAKDIYSKPVTRPRPRGPVTKESSQGTGRSVLLLPDGSQHVIRKIEPADSMMPSKVELWRDLLKNFIPMRNNLCTFWAATVLGYKDVPSGQFLKTTSLSDLRTLRTMSSKLPIFNERQNMLLNAWNHLVNRGLDKELHELWCAEAFFWQNPRYNRTQDTPYISVGRFQADLIGFVFSLDIEPTEYLRFDQQKLELILEEASSPKTKVIDVQVDTSTHES